MKHGHVCPDMFEPPEPADSDRTLVFFLLCQVVGTEVSWRELLSWLGLRWWLLNTLFKHEAELLDETKFMLFSWTPRHILRSVFSRVSRFRIVMYFSVWLCAAKIWLIGRYHDIIGWNSLVHVYISTHHILSYRRKTSLDFLGFFVVFCMILTRCDCGCDLL